MIDSSTSFVVVVELDSLEEFPVALEEELPAPEFEDPESDAGDEELEAPESPDGDEEFEAPELAGDDELLLPDPPDAAPLPLPFPPLLLPGGGGPSGPDGPAGLLLVESPGLPPDDPPGPLPPPAEDPPPPPAEDPPPPSAEDPPPPLFPPGGGGPSGPEAPAGFW